MQAVFYSFSKRKNSTAAPSDSGRSYEITLKNGCSYLRPIFLLSADDFNYNYCEFNGRYYWVSDINAVRSGLFEVSCMVDVLASWADSIKSTQSFVKYSASDIDKNITDYRNAVTIEKEVQYAVATSETGVFSPLWQSQGGIYLLATMGAVNSEVAMQSFCGLYALDSGQLPEVAKILNSEEVLQQLINFFTTPTDTVIFCRWFPVGFDVAGINTANVTFGIYETDISATILTKNYATDILDVVIPWLKDDFRRVEPFTAATLYLPGVGNVPLNLSAIANCKTLSIHATVDFVSNQVHYGLFNTVSGDLIGTYSGTLGADIPVASVQNNVGGVLSAVGTMVGGYALATGAGLAGEVASAGSVMAITGGAAAGVMAANQQVVKSSGNFGGGYSVYSGQGILPVLTMTRSISKQEPSEYLSIMGNPCMKSRIINGLTGYCQTDGFQVVGNMTEQEKTEINMMMDGGVYIE